MGPKDFRKKVLKSLTAFCPTSFAADLPFLSRWYRALAISFCCLLRTSASNHFSSLMLMSFSSSASMASKNVSSWPMSQPHLWMPSMKASREQQSASGLIAASRTQLIMSRALWKRMPHQVRKLFHWCASSGQSTSRVISPSSSSSSSLHRPIASPWNLSSAKPRLNSWKVTEPLMFRSKIRIQAASTEGCPPASIRNLLIICCALSLRPLFLAHVGILLLAKSAVAVVTAVEETRSRLAPFWLGRGPMPRELEGDPGADTSQPPSVEICKPLETAILCCLALCSCIAISAANG
mmetsp:Transcript_71657/g.184807  ORF Transcript_71657/g.184807 Transcript_71657/m.184807 type:complete len:294 (+) Transcript_71657:1424-2305(+)